MPLYTRGIFHSNAPFLLAKISQLVQRSIMTRIYVSIVSSLLLLTASSTLLAQRALPPDTVITSSDKVKVTYADLEAELARVPEKDRYEFLLGRQRLAKLVELVLINKTMAGEAVAMGLDKLPKVQAEIRNETMKVLVKHRGEKLQENAPKVDIERRAREIYLVERDRFKQPAKYDTWHVLIDSKSRNKDEAKKRAEEVRKLVLASGATDEIATQYSNDPSAAKNKGRIGFMVATALDPAYARTMQKLKVDEVSEVIESQFGYHVIVLKGTQPESRLSFEAVKTELMAEAETKYLDSVYYAHLAAIQSDPSIKVNVDALEALRPETPSAPAVPKVPSVITTPNK
jgi:peptidyl-prolyl cis-trans isomerase C